MPLDVVSTQRDIAGSVAPIKTVGGSRQIAATSPRNSMLTTPDPAHAVYMEPIIGIPNKRTTPSKPMDNSMAAYTSNGCDSRGTTRENSKLPRHIPPMNVPSSIPSEKLDEPTINSSNCNHTTS